MMLADLGADVLRVVAPGPGSLRAEMPSGEPNPLDLTLHRNKRSITVNMKSESSREVIKRLIERHDVLVEQLRPGVMQRLGWDYPAAKAVNEKIIYCSLTGYGQNGPLKDRAGHDIVVVARPAAGELAERARRDRQRSRDSLNVGAPKWPPHPRRSEAPRRSQGAPRDWEEDPGARQSDGVDVHSSRGQSLRLRVRPRSAVRRAA